MSNFLSAGKLWMAPLSTDIAFPDCTDRSISLFSSVPLPSVSIASKTSLSNDSTSVDTQKDRNSGYETCPVF